MKKLHPEYSHRNYWLIFFLVNGLYLLPWYLCFMKHNQFFPFEEIKAPFREPSLIFARASKDIFRLCGEWVVLGAMILFSKSYTKLHTYILKIGVPIYTFFFYFQVYYAIMRSLYANHPYLPGDLTLAYQVLPNFMEVINIGGVFTYLGIAILAIAITFGVFISIKFMMTCIHRSEAQTFSYVSMGCLLLFVGVNSLVNIQTPWHKADRLSTHWISHKIYFSLFQPRSSSFSNPKGIKSYTSYQNHALAQKPDIYFLCVESYGKVLLTAPEFQFQFEQSALKLQKSLEKKGYHIASSYSLSPIAGGKSWLAFTTLLTGTRISNQRQYLNLQKFHYTYPHLIRYLNGQGYETTRMKVLLETNKVAKQDYDLANRFFGFDHFLKQPDFPYKGFAYNFFGGIPDQYSLGHFWDKMKRDMDKPQFLFYITMDSHGPWFIPAPILEDWRALDTISSHPDPRIPPGASINNRSELLIESMETRFPEVIDHELRVIDDFIAKNTDRPAIYILVGDHQPALISNYDHDGLETMIHIVSKDSAFVESFKENGFKLGMNQVTDSIRGIRHEGFYSLFMEKLIRRYGVERESGPEYLEEGI